MSDKFASAADRVRVIADDGGDALWFLGGLMVVKADSALTQGRLSFIDQLAPPNFAPPRHIHRDEDEAWYVLDGEVTFFAGDRRLSAEKGAFAFLPKGVEHSFVVGRSGARLLTMTTSGSFADFVRSMSEPAAGHVLPPLGAPPTEDEQRRLAEVAARYGIEITGPPPTLE